MRRALRGSPPFVTFRAGCEGRRPRQQNSGEGGRPSGYRLLDVDVQPSPYSERSRGSA
ncbi:MAG: hypothetical protein QF819_04585 [Gemmatimonadota bacterium]|nr:hypothetical protein [Gemmatimonadota bacterium]